MINFKITKHAIDRARERLGLNVSSLKKSAHLSLTEGIDALGDPVLREMCIHKAKKYNVSGIYLYKNAVFIFVEDILVTVYPIHWLSGYQSELYN